MLEDEAQEAQFAFLMFVFQRVLSLRFGTTFLAEPLAVSVCGAPTSCSFFSHVTRSFSLKHLKASSVTSPSSGAVSRAKSSSTPSSDTDAGAAGLISNTRAEIFSYIPNGSEDRPRSPKKVLMRHRIIEKINDYYPDILWKKDKVIRTMRRHGIYTDLRLDFKDKKVEYWKKRGRIPVKKGSGKGSK